MLLEVQTKVQDQKDLTKWLFNKSLNGEILNILKTPFSQAYDIILSDGNKIDQRHSIDTNNFIKFFENEF